MLRCAEGSWLRTVVTLPKALRDQPIRTSKASKRRKDLQKQYAPHLASRQTEPKTPCDFALTFFDDHYGSMFGDEWHQARLGLLSPHKPAALINNFAEASEIKRDLEDLGCYSIQTLFNNRTNNDIIESSDDTLTREKPFPVFKPAEERERMVVQGNARQSMQADEAKDRIISPDHQILGNLGGSSTLYDFVPGEDMTEIEDFVEESSYFKDNQAIEHFEFPIKVTEVAPLITIPKHLDAYYFPAGSLQRFKAPRKGTLGTPNYYCMDLSSLLPVIALNIKPNDSILDMCSGPGGKSLAMLQTLMPSWLLCADKDNSRLKRVRRTVEYYLKNFGSDLKSNVKYMRVNGKELPASYLSTFDKVLCDVPCFTDRTVVHDPDSNVFHPKRKQERIRLPRIQADLLKSAILCAKPGGTIVYSTCTLSPMQNDGVVFHALKQIWEGTNLNVEIEDISESLRPFNEAMNLFGIGELTNKFGILAVPSIFKNYGPMYIARLKRMN